MTGRVVLFPGGEEVTGRVVLFPGVEVYPGQSYPLPGSGGVPRAELPASQRRRCTQGRVIRFLEEEVLWAGLPAS